MKEDVVPRCVNCPIHGNCRGARTFAQIVAHSGASALPWNNRGFGICPSEFFIYLI